jgi:hypothetical protein
MFCCLQFTMFSLFSSPSAGSSGGSRGHPLLTQPVARLLGRGLKMANRRHSSGPADEQPFSCVDCDER